MPPDFALAFEMLHDWCRRRGYAGHDPFDALNSRLFREVPLLNRSRAARLVWTQLLKRSPFDLRGVAGVPVGRNSKGLALFALALVSRVRADENAPSAPAAKARELFDLLLQEKIETPSGVAWGYNFDWQGRAFYAPRGTPTVVPTAFAVRALTEGYATLKDQSYLAAAQRACGFLTGDLARSEESGDEVCFSYTPGDRTRVFNASLLAGEAMATVGALTGDENLTELGERAARYVVRRQRADGSWAYGAEDYQSWSDNFHTAFILTSLKRIGEVTRGAKDRELFAAAVERGADFWRDRFFLADGWPKYYHDRLYPADAHSAGAGVIALLELGDEKSRSLARRVAAWSIDNLRDPQGFFYYQRRRRHTVRTPYMRWTQSWMLYALARMLEESDE